ncbi:hypothetical protein ATZ33_08285 [Enterococcus silesiacus]|uniref:Mga helix-turn-helix domain-containing protein n=1 Tax=Enterococcus silesiacus TaxID=332949 RepID=A0A0S3KAW4_9ENTE|nr:helix-turn-helix domain-containing protein [Enterococcus silesiacus]ALS01364.1 hypothetical protein ATZ33_08285 [Enterococcus silesiacus]OJG88590.1 hypothetical protein RV15_GL001775 [Enterococcus silesiacus]
MNVDLRMRALEIYDKDTQAQVILFALLSSKDSWFSIAELEKSSSFERRKINDCIDSLNQTISEANLKNFYIEYEKKRGYHLIAKNIILEDFISFLLKKTLEFKLLSAIYWETFVSVRKFSLTHHVSESSVIRKLNKLKMLLKKFDLSLSRKNFRLIGKETQIRVLYCFISWKYHEPNEWPYSHIISEQATCLLIKKIETFFNIGLNQIKKKKLAYVLANCCFRVKKAHKLKLNNTFRLYITNNPVFEKFKTQLPELYEHFNYSEEEIAFLFILFMTKDTYYLDPILQNDLVTFHSERSTPAYLCYQKIVSQSKKAQSLSNDEKRILTSYLLSIHITYNLFYSFRSKTILYNLAEIYDSKVLALIQPLIDSLKQANLIPPNRDITYLLEQYIHIASYLFDLATLKKTVNVLLVSDLSVVENHLISLSLTTYYSTLCNLNIHYYEQEDTCYDFIITNNTVVSSRLANVKKIFFYKNINKENYIKIVDIINSITKTKPNDLE